MGLDRSSTGIFIFPVEAPLLFAHLLFSRTLHYCEMYVFGVGLQVF
jgi:hypothetical protein